jgi:hypothetical protein
MNPEFFLILNLALLSTRKEGGKEGKKEGRKNRRKKERGSELYGVQ